MATHVLCIDRQQSVLGGVSQNARAYLPYGASKAWSGSHLGFTGQRPDPLTASYPLGSGRRFYSPTLMRFMTPDSLSPFGRGGINAYAYCGCDPVNRIDPGAQFWHRIVGMVSSSVTALGALTRTAKNEALRLQDLHRGGGRHTLDYTPPPLLSRIGNTAFVVTGVSGVTGNLLLGQESRWVGDAMISLSSRFGVANAVGNSMGGITSNLQAARVVWALMGQPGIPSSSVVFGTFAEVTGMRMVGEAVAYVGRQSWALASRFSQAVGAGVSAWRQSGAARPPANIELTNVRRGATSP